MTRSGRVKSYWSAIGNLHKRLNSSSDIGRGARSEYFSRTKNKKLKESNFNKNLDKGVGISKAETRRFYKIARQQHDKQLKRDYKESKKAGNKASFAEFKRANKEPDWDLIQELFNSPK